MCCRCVLCDCLLLFWAPFSSFYIVVVDHLTCLGFVVNDVYESLAQKCTESFLTCEHPVNCENSEMSRCMIDLKKKAIDVLGKPLFYFYLWWVLHTPHVQQLLMIACCFTHTELCFYAWSRRLPFCFSLCRLYFATVGRRISDQRRSASCFDVCFNLRSLCSVFTYTRTSVMHNETQATLVLQSCRHLTVTTSLI